jgi:hypothetical protein
MEGETLISKELKDKAGEAWIEYEKAILKAWQYPTGARLLADGFVESLATFDEERVKGLIEWLQAQAKEISAMKFVGER